MALKKEDIIIIEPKEMFVGKKDAPLAHVTDATGSTVPETGSTRLQPGGGLSTGTFFHLIASAP